MEDRVLASFLHELYHNSFLQSIALCSKATDSLFLLTSCLKRQFEIRKKSKKRQSFVKNCRLFMGRDYEKDIFKPQEQRSA